MTDRDPLAPLRTADWLRYGPFLAHLVITRRCNLTCGYCNEYDRVSPPVPYDLLTARLRKLRELRAWMVCLTGGEPTLHPDLIRILRLMAELGFRRRQLLTNGYRLTKRLIGQLNDVGLTDLQISVDGVKRNPTTVKVLEPLRGRLELLAREARFRVVLSGVIGSAPPSEALDVVRFARTHRLTPRIILLHDGKGRLSLSAEERTAFDEVARLLGRSGREAGDYRQRLLDQGAAPFHCRAGARYLYVDEDGRVHWCSQTRDGFGKDLLAYTLADLREQFHTPKRCADACTVGCARSASAYDEWRGQRPASEGRDAPLAPA
jgi:MoaA/NifB/PqqE/SkfB family radical SAM enzyme